MLATSNCEHDLHEENAQLLEALEADGLDIANNMIQHVKIGKHPEKQGPEDWCARLETMIGVVTTLTMLFEF